MTRTDDLDDSDRRLRRTADLLGARPGGGPCCGRTDRQRGEKTQTGGAEKRLGQAEQRKDSDRQRREKTRTGRAEKRLGQAEKRKDTDRQSGEKTRTSRAGKRLGQAERRKDSDRQRREKTRAGREEKRLGQRRLSTDRLGVSATERIKLRPGAGFAIRKESALAVDCRILSKSVHLVSELANTKYLDGGGGFEFSLRIGMNPGAGPGRRVKQIPTAAETRTDRYRHAHVR